MRLAAGGHSVMVKSGWGFEFIVFGFFFCIGQVTMMTSDNFFFFFQFWTRLLETTFKKWSWRKVFVIGCVALVTWQETKAASASLTNRATLLRVTC